MKKVGLSKRQANRISEQYIASITETHKDANEDRYESSGHETSEEIDNIHTEPISSDNDSVHFIRCGYKHSG